MLAIQIASILATRINLAYTYISISNMSDKNRGRDAGAAPSLVRPLASRPICALNFK